MADHVDYAARATDFHAEMVALAGNETLAVLVGQLHNVMRRHTAAAASSAVSAKRDTVENRRKAQEAHLKFIELVKARDADRAQDFWRRHMEAAAPLLLANGAGRRSIVDVMG
jgi:GntR family transcriptional regulator, transcriptional repressor for pyruvate dehydrogenase complex